jgi:subfamily B ATP-binding cassette protein HlyB/CyaB
MKKALGRDEALWLLGSLSQLHRLPFDARLVAQQFPPPYTQATFHEAARSLGFKTGAHRLDGSRGHSKRTLKTGVPFECPALCNLNLSFKPGHLTVLAGASGCGKSTLAKLLLGFYLPQEGKIALDGKDIRYLAANELRSVFGVVPQETVLFSGTLYDNLVMAHPHATFAEVIQACKDAEIHEVIESLSEGYQTEIGERGTGLSGGQRQRLAIARALLKKPKILIFDEAVSNLDQQTAELFAKTINKLKGKVTMLFITHQVPKGLHVDEVVELGAIVRQMGLVEEAQAG